MQSIQYQRQVRSPNCLKNPPLRVKIGADIKLAMLAGACVRKKRKGRGICSLRSQVNPKREFYSVVFFLFLIVYYTLEAERYGKWVSCHFWPVAAGKKVAVSWSWNKSKQEVLPVEEARNLWRNLQRKGWKVDNAVVGF